MTEKLDTELDQGVIKQTRHKIKPIRFRNDAINKVKKEHYEFGNKRYLFIPFSVDKETLAILSALLAKDWIKKTNLAKKILD